MASPVFDAQQKGQVPDADILSRYSTREDLVPLAAVHNPETVDCSGILDREDLIRLLEDRESLVEIHIHGPVKRDHIHTIAMQKERFVSLAKRTLDYERASAAQQRTQQYDKVRAYKRLLELRDQHDVLLVVE